MFVRFLALTIRQQHLPRGLYLVFTGRSLAPRLGGLKGDEMSNPNSHRKPEKCGTRVALIIISLFVAVLPVREQTVELLFPVPNNRITNPTPHQHRAIAQ